MLSSLGGLLAELREEEFLTEVQKRLAAGGDPLQLINECQKGMEQVGKLFEADEYFISDLVMSAGMFSDAMDQIGPRLKGDGDRARPPVVMGTAKGDIHDIGKNIVATILRCNGYDVTDIGVDAPPEKFIEAVRASGAKLVGISALLTTTFPRVKEIVDAFKAAGLHGQVKIMIGGGPVDERVCAMAGADGVGTDAMAAVRLAHKLLEVD